MSADVAAKLRKLYALAVLRPEEEKDEARMNEARNAAYLMLKTAKQAGVGIQFVRRTMVEVPVAAAPQEAASTDDGSNPWTTPHMRRWYEQRRGRGRL